MTDLMLFLNQPAVLATLFVGSVVLVLLDYLLPIDWLAYLGYACFALFVGATSPAGPGVSLLVAALVFAVVWVLHEYFFAHFLTNAPRYEAAPEDTADPAGEPAAAEPPAEA